MAVLLSRSTEREARLRLRCVLKVGRRLGMRLDISKVGYGSFARAALPAVVFDVPSLQFKAPMCNML